MIPLEERCKKDVPNGGRSVSFHKCTFKAIKDGFCKRHHPDEEKTRQEAIEKRWAEGNKRMTRIYRLNKLRNLVAAAACRFVDTATGERLEKLRLAVAEYRKCEKRCKEQS